MAKEEKMTWAVIERQPVKVFNRYQMVKRLFDLAVCSLIMPIFLPIGLLIWAIIRLDSSGPGLFVQDRVGRGGKLFRIYKFRTLNHQLDDSNHRAFMKSFVHGQIEQQNGDTVFKPFTANQVTRIGNLLRKTSLDEIPQIINVLKGEMSLVGPRPNVVWEVEAYLDWHKERLEVLPGITGLAQVRGRSGILFDEIVYWDIEYIKHQSFALDLQILLETVLSAVLAKGAK